MAFSALSTWRALVDGHAICWCSLVQMPKSNRPPQAARGKLLTLTGDVPGGNRTYTYDSAGRVRTMTDSEGYTLTYDYDNLDRVRVVTYPDASFEQFEYADPSLIRDPGSGGRWVGAGTRSAPLAAALRSLVCGTASSPLPDRWLPAKSLRAPLHAALGCADSARSLPRGVWKIRPRLGVASMPK
ncbi:MAG: RHS repeat protein [Deltaproteobacteria bacterium]|nr:RHS repeat protein [Deltaproteobacteria bacterium]